MKTPGDDQHSDQGLRGRVARLARDFAALTGDTATYPGASEAEIQGLREAAGGALPADYLAFLRLSNGFLSDLDGAAGVVSATAAFSPYLPGALFLGGDGGEGKLVLDLRGGDPARMPCLFLPDERLDWRAAARTWGGFTEMFLDLYPEDLFAREIARHGPHGE